MSPTIILEFQTPIADKADYWLENTLNQSTWVKGNFKKLTSWEITANKAMARPNTPDWRLLSLPCQIYGA